MKQKVFFIIFKGILLKQRKQNFFGGESPTLSCCMFLLRSELLILRNRILTIIFETNYNKLFDSSWCLILIHCKLL